MANVQQMQRAIEDLRFRLREEVAAVEKYKVTQEGLVKDLETVTAERDQLADKVVGLTQKLDHKSELFREVSSAFSAASLQFSIEMAKRIKYLRDPLEFLADKDNWLTTIGKTGEIVQPLVTEAGLWDIAAKALENFDASAK